MGDVVDLTPRRILKQEERQIQERVEAAFGNLRAFKNKGGSLRMVEVLGLSLPEFSADDIEFCYPLSSKDMKLVSDIVLDIIEHSPKGMNLISHDTYTSQQLISKSSFALGRFYKDEIPTEPKGINIEKECRNRLEEVEYDNFEAFKGRFLNSQNDSAKVYYLIDEFTEFIISRNEAEKWD